MKHILKILSKSILPILIIIALLFRTHIVAKINYIAFAGFALLFIFLVAKVVNCVDYSNIQINNPPPHLYPAEYGEGEVFVCVH